MVVRTGTVRVAFGLRNPVAIEARVRPKNRNLNALSPYSTDLRNHDPDPFIVGDPLTAFGH